MLTTKTPTSIAVGAAQRGSRTVVIGDGSPLTLIGGPCAIESRDHSLRMADKIASICAGLEIQFIFKSSYDKDCRSSPDSYLGCGIDTGLQVLADVRSEIGVPVTSDFADPAWAEATGNVCDLVQVPAYLCRQTSILRAAAETGRPVHVKKGQFMSPWNMLNSVAKLERFGASEILLTDRGTFFGYDMLVSDMRSLPIMASSGYPVCYDATHSVQEPTSHGAVSGGHREFIPSLVRAATATGIQALFMEIHDNPRQALSDPGTQLDLSLLKPILEQAKAIHECRISLAPAQGEINF